MFANKQAKETDYFAIAQICKKNLPHTYDEVLRERLRELDELGLRAGSRSLMFKIKEEIELNISKGQAWGIALIGNMVAELTVSIVTAGFANSLKKTASAATIKAFDSLQNGIADYGVINSFKDLNKVGMNRETAEFALSIGAYVPILGTFTQQISNSLLIADAVNAVSQQKKLLYELKDKLSHLESLMAEYEFKIRSYETKIRAMEYAAGCIMSNATNAPSPIIR